ncbi:MAG: hypothetical protein QOJ39_8, partial [Candidatus Eremiobacteraeota bacterium]|nr:hypothetical protein [Candidatus Eremiobacteraeota bacterium]
YNKYFDLEVGDACRQYITTIPLNSQSYTLQPEYSNAYHACTNTP